MFFKRASSDDISADVSDGLARALRHAAAKDPHALRERERKIENAIAALEAAAQGVDAVNAILYEARDLAASAADSESLAKRALIAERYNDLVETLGEPARKAGANGVNLIDGGDDEIEIDLPGANASKMIVRHTRLTPGEGGLDIEPARDAFAEDAEIAGIQKQIDAAMERLNGLAERFCGDAEFLTERLASHEAA